jgi:alkanesulfonate monooxygenase SsuD/methylene tetrahydromethanopterin reductase-like flavin-dependent oxidoreductase (luciferase family)
LSSIQLRRPRTVKAEITRGPFDPGGQPALRRKDHMHLSLFAWNVRSGLSASKAVLSDPSRLRDFWEWPSASVLLREAERAGFDSHLQYGMWSGYDGATQWNEANLDFASAAAASSAITDRLGIISTLHVGYDFHPVLIGKIMASTDHISGGRLGVNVIVAQNEIDYRQFGFTSVRPKAERYDMADEFVTLLKHLWSSEHPIDFEGDYFQAYGAQVNPRPSSAPRPLLVCAAGSDTGLGFATKQCDALFITSDDSTLAGYAARANKLHNMAATHGREVRICAMCYVVMDETDEKALETVKWMREEIDRDALDTWLTRSGHVSNSENEQIAPDQIGAARLAQENQDPYLGIGQEHYDALGLGMGAYQLFGSYETVADEIAGLYQAGVEQVALCFFDPHKGVQQVREHLLPALRRRGLNKGD